MLSFLDITLVTVASMLLTLGAVAFADLPNGETLGGADRRVAVTTIDRDLGFPSGIDGGRRLEAVRRADQAPPELTVSR